MQTAELADLHIRRSVSSTLESDFRNRLEALIQDILRHQQQVLVLVGGRFGTLD